jgi:uncharacterized protein (DUF2384 family)
MERSRLQRLRQNFECSKGKPGMVSRAETVLTKSALSVADRLKINQETLAVVLGLSRATVSRMRRGSFTLKRSSGKSFELAQLLIELHELLDRMLAGDGAATRSWLVAENSALTGRRPIDLIQSVHGLVEVVGYLRARSSL